MVHTITAECKFVVRLPYSPIQFFYGSTHSYVNLGSEEKIMLIAHVEALFAERCIGVGTQEFIDIRRGKKSGNIGREKINACKLV